MKQVLDAFRAPMSNGQQVRQLTTTEFSKFWQSLSNDEKELYKANAAEMGFTS